MGGKIPCSFMGNWGSRETAPKTLRYFGYESDNEGVQRQRFDQHQSENESEADSALSSGIPCTCFGRRSGDFSLSQGAKAGRDAHGEISGRQAQVGCPPTCGGLCKDRAGQ